MKSTKDCVIRLKNRKTGTTYLYYGHSDYDKNGKCTTKGARKSIGKINAQGEFQPNSTFLLMPEEEQLATGLVESPYLPPARKEAVEGCERNIKYYGPVAAVEAAARQTGVYEALRKVFPSSYLAIMSIVESMLVLPARGIYRPKRFHEMFWHANVDMLTEGEITAALEAAASDENRRRFFSILNRNRTDADLVLALDTTSLSTYSAMLAMAKRGFNKENDSLDQVNLLMVCDSTNGIPAYYRVLDGNMSDRKVLDATLEDLKKDNLAKGSVLTMDRGFCTAENLTKILRAGYRFLMCVPSNGPYWAEAVEAALPDIDSTENYHASINRWCSVVDAKVPCPRRGRGENSVPMSMYVFKDAAAAAAERERLAKKFAKGLSDLSADPSLYSKGWYKKHYILQEMAKGRKGAVFSHNTEAQKEELERCGLHVMIGPKGWSAEKVDSLYARRDSIEKGFENWKEKMRRPRHSLDEHLEGKAFIMYILSILDSRMRETAREWLLDTNGCFADAVDVIYSARWKKEEGKDFRSGHWIDLTREQIKTLHIFGVPGMAKLMGNVQDQVETDLLHRQGLKAKRGRKKKIHPA